MKGTLTPALSILVAILVFFFFTQEHFAQAQKTQAEIKAHEEARDKYAEFNETVRALLAKRDGVSLAERERLDLLIPSKIDVTRLVVDLEKIARDSGMLFGNIKATEDKANKQITSTEDTDTSEIDTGSLETADISFDVIGTYEQFKALMETIEGSLPLFEVTKITLQVSDEVFQKYEVSVRTFSIPDAHK